LKLKPPVILVVTDATGTGTTKVVVVTMIPQISKLLSAVLAQMKNQLGRVTALKLSSLEILEVMAAAGIGITQTHAESTMMMTLLPLSAALVPERTPQPLKMTSSSSELTALIFNTPQTPVVMDATGTMVTRIHVALLMTMTS